ncbi:hypothetical protein M407DRAFT_16952 [Tulasnella calospora MUT 4182]|uniref:Uncharacterized protein n=1 Tax=Tulasnella calospora MUT 4182 TaxID=1051891 RepID=A0A0C3QMX4_9AGAM|nr:hypothetical protein M407DRAFT_16952 [Tulasnella calospora MUT 4182]
MESLGAGRIRFTSYRKDNTWMLDPEEEVPSDFVKTVSEHLVGLSDSGRLTFYLAPEEEEYISYGVYNTDIDDTEQRFPFICPFSGIIGSVAETGHLFIWRLE